MWKLSNDSIAPLTYERLLAPVYDKQQKEAVQIIEKYGKDRAIERCEEIIFSYQNDINTLPYYDNEKIPYWDSQIHFWNEVKVLCLNWC